MLCLGSVLAKIERADEHARLLDQELTAWIKGTPYTVSRNVNSDFTRHSVLVSVTTPPPIQRWSLILGDAIHNLRSALDHLVYAISVHELKADPPPNADKCAFVINDTPNGFKSKYSCIQGLSLPVRQAIESVQPYNRKHSSMPPLLGVLRDFDDAHKHRLIKVVLQRPAGFKLTATGTGLRADELNFNAPYVDLVDGAEVAWVTTKRPTPHLRLKWRP